MANGDVVISQASAAALLAAMNAIVAQLIVLNEQLAKQEILTVKVQS